MAYLLFIHPGAHQFKSPSTFISDGTNRALTTVLSGISPAQPTASSSNAPTSSIPPSKSSFRAWGSQDYR